MAAHGSSRREPKTGSHGGPHNAGQATKVYDHRFNGKPIGEPSTKGNKIRGKLAGQTIR